MHNSASHVTLDVFVLFAHTKEPTVLIVPHIPVKPGDTMPWAVVATGAMKAARLSPDEDEAIRVQRQSNATIFYGVARHQNRVLVNFYGEQRGPERTIYVTPALILRVPGPFVRLADGYAVVALPAFGSPDPTITTIVGGDGAASQGVGDPALAISLTMTYPLGPYQLTAVTPQPASNDPLKWTTAGFGYLRVSATGIDPQHSDNTERNNIYAGLLLGFAFSLLIPLTSTSITATRPLRA
jgi:hypothetical protein